MINEKGLNRAEVAENIEKLIEKLESEKNARIARAIENVENDMYSAYYKRYIIKQEKNRKTNIRIDKVYEELSIFDWWNEYISISQLKQMRNFLKTAERLGYNGYVCFKVGSVGCANGMWASKKESLDGYSPDGECLYHSFVCNENNWDACLPNGEWVGTLKNRWDLSLKEVVDEIKKFNANGEKLNDAV